MKTNYLPNHQGCSGLMIGLLDLGLSSQGPRPRQGHCVVFLGKTLYSHCGSLQPGLQKGAGSFNAGGNPMVDEHPIQVVLEILPVTSCYRNQD